MAIPTLHASIVFTTMQFSAPQSCSASTNPGTRQEGVFGCCTGGVLKLNFAPLWGWQLITLMPSCSLHTIVLVVLSGRLVT